MQENANYHILGLGGIGMSAIARLLKQKGCTVSGEDKNRSSLVELLEKEGVEFITPESLDNTTLIYSTAIKDHPLLKQANESNAKCLHRAEILNELLSSQTSLLVTGTHGKTTTSSLLTHVLIELGQDPSFAVGGILKEKNTNAILGKGKYFVAEADESDGSFLKLKKDAVIITNLEEEHLEYWKNKKHLEEAFSQFAQEAKLLVYSLDDPNLSSFCQKGISFGSTPKADFYYQNYRAKDLSTLFDIHTKNHVYKDVELSLLGEHNVKNALAVFALLTSLGLSPDLIIKAFNTFKGVKRRLDIHRNDSIILIDDYAHHPTEIVATLKALDNLSSKRRLIAVFQPHKSTRFKEFYTEFLKAFDHADRVILTDIYEVGEKVEVSLEEFAKKMGKKCSYIPKSQLENYLKQILLPFDVLIALGAGDIVQILEPLKSFRKTMKTALLYGGESLEHEISILSAKTFYKGLIQPNFTTSLFCLDKEGIWSECTSFDSECKKLEKKQFLEQLLDFDLVVPCFHGPMGEDGTIQGFLKTLRLSYVSAGPLGCGLAMNKALAKRIALSYGIKTAKFLELKKYEYNRELVVNLLTGFTYPLFVKPCSLGSSYGVFEIKDESQLFVLIEKAFSFDEHLLLEEKVEGEEIEVGLIGNKRPEVGLIARLPMNGNVHTYETKYGAHAIVSEIPAKIDSHLEKKFINCAKLLYKAFDMSVFARIDFFLKGDQIYFNEINPIPGMTSSSPFPIMFEKKKISIELLVQYLASLAIKKNG